MARVTRLRPGGHSRSHPPHHHPPRPDQAPGQRCVPTRGCGRASPSGTPVGTDWTCRFSRPTTAPKRCVSPATRHRKVNSRRLRARLGVQLCKGSELALHRSPVSGRPLADCLPTVPAAPDDGFIGSSWADSGPPPVRHPSRVCISSFYRLLPVSRPPPARLPSKVCTPSVFRFQFISCPSTVSLPSAYRPSPVRLSSVSRPPPARLPSLVCTPSVFRFQSVSCPSTVPPVSRLSLVRLPSAFRPSPVSLSPVFRPSVVCLSSARLLSVHPPPHPARLPSPVRLLSVFCPSLVGLPIASPHPARLPSVCRFRFCGVLRLCLAGLVAGSATGSIGGFL